MITTPFSLTRNLKDVNYIGILRKNLITCA